MMRIDLCNLHKNLSHRPAKALKTYGLLALTLSTINNAYSHSGHNQKLFQLTLKELLEIRVESPTLTSKTVVSAPSSVSVFTGQQISNMGVEFLHELINYAPGFQSFRQGENGLQYYHSSRGHRNSVTGREILVLVDGIRLNREYDNNYAVPMFALHNVQKIEFIRGPGSALYGSNAFLGVIDIQTDQNKKELQASTGLDDTFRLSLQAGGELKGWQFTLSASGFKEGGQTLELQDYSDLSSISSQDPRQGQDLSLTAQNENTALKILNYNREADDFYRAERVSDSQNFARFTSQIYSIKHSVDWPLPVDSTIDLSYSSNSYNANADFGALGNIAADQSESNIDFSLRNHWQKSENQSYEFGMDYRHSNIDAYLFDTEAMGTLVFYPETTRERLGFYLQSQRQLRSDLEVTIGARYDHHYDTGSSISPRIALVHTLTDHHTLKALYGKAFRSPTENELSLSTFSGALSGNPDLSPETIQTWEFAWLGNWEYVSTSITAHYNVISSTIIREDNSANSVFGNLSEDEAFYGLELELAKQLGKHLLITANSSLVKNQPSSDFRQSDRLVSLVINYHQSNWNFNLGANYFGDRKFTYIDDFQGIDDYWLLNSKLNYRINDKTNLYALGKNILNTNYGTPTQRTVHSEPIANRGAEASVGVTFSL